MRSLPHRKDCSRALHHYTYSYASENLSIALEFLDQSPKIVIYVGIIEFNKRSCSVGGQIDH